MVACTCNRRGGSGGAVQGLAGLDGGEGQKEGLVLVVGHQQLSALPASLPAKRSVVVVVVVVMVVVVVAALLRATLVTSSPTTMPFRNFHLFPHLPPARALES